MNKNKVARITAIISCAAIITLGGFMFNKLHNGHQTNQLIIDQCFDTFEEVEVIALKKDDFLSPIICEKK